MSMLMDVLYARSYLNVCMSYLYRRLVSGSCEIQSSVYSVQLTVILANCWLMQLLKLKNLP